MSEGVDPLADGPMEPPVSELADLDEPPSDRLITNVLEGIDRRQTGTRLAEVSWWGVTDLLMEFLRALFSVIGGRGDDGTKRGG